MLEHTEKLRMKGANFFGEQTVLPLPTMAFYSDLQDLGVERQWASIFQVSKELIQSLLMSNVVDGQILLECGENYSKGAQVVEANSSRGELL
jgi:hypothetical protein